MKTALLKLRAFYLVTGLSGGILVPYLSLLFEHNGFTSGTVGLIMAIGTFVSVLTQPLWGIIVDKFQFTRLTLGMSATVPGILAVVFDVKWLWVVVFANAVWNIFSSPQTPTADAYAVTSAAKTGTSYGSIRLFGSLGFALGGYVSGEYLAHEPLTSIWLPYIVISLLGGAIALMLPKNDVRFASRVPIRDGISALLRDRRFIFFLIGGFLVSQTLTAFNTYFALTFQAMGGSFALTGVAFFIASATNVPAMLVARFVIDRIGRETTLLIASFAYVLRWGVQAFLPIPWVAIVIQVLHGVSFGFYYVSAVGFVYQSAEKDLQTTAQSIFGMICTGLAGIVGNLLNGYLIHDGGPFVMYLSCTISSLLGSLCFFYVLRLGRTNRGTIAPETGRRLDQN